MVHRVGDQLGHDTGEGIELVARVGVAGDQAFLDPGPAHQPPFVVIMAKPERAKLVPALVLGDLGRGQVVVVVENRLVCRVLVIQPTRRLIVQQKLVVNKRHGTRLL